MQVVVATDFDQWRTKARQLLAAGVPPDGVHFSDSTEPSLFGKEDRDSLSGQTASSDRRLPRVPRRFLEMAEYVACHRDPARFELLYRAVWRMGHGAPQLFEVATDDDVHRLRTMEKAVRRDEHKAHAFVRFRRVVADSEEQFIAWHRPDHRIVRLIGPFFARRFPTMDWAILTPDESVFWDRRQLQYGPGVPVSEAPQSDDLEELWRTYYGSIFNPARVSVRTMIREMPVRHWRTLPETQMIPDLLAAAPKRVEQMIQKSEGSPRSAADYLPETPQLPQLQQAAVHCEGCDLHRSATQTVFGQGPQNARFMLVGEQPGDEEDRAGEPFVGPAGRILTEALQEAGLDRAAAYITNTVKHFKFEPRGQRRLHKKPSAREINACRPWLEAEIATVAPEVLVCLGATAATTLLGRDFRITRQRGRFLRTEWCPATIATYHPSAILRARDTSHRDQIRRELISDLKQVATWLA